MRNTKANAHTAVRRLMQPMATKMAMYDTLPTALAAKGRSDGLRHAGGERRQPGGRHDGHECHHAPAEPAPHDELPRRHR